MTTAGSTGPGSPSRGQKPAAPPSEAPLAGPRDADGGETSGGVAKAEAVRRMFSDIAPRYDLLNHLLSLNVDRLWRRAAARALVADRPPRRVLDACAGTLDLSLAIAPLLQPDASLVAADFAVPMLELGKPKIGAAPIREVAADGLRLPFADRSFDAASVAFGVRNLADPAAGLRELVRVLQPGGRLVVLEFSTPSFAPLRAAYRLYFHRVLPWVGRLLSRHEDAYTYLPASVDEFPPPTEFAAMMRAAGFARVRWRRLTGGIATLHLGEAGPRTDPPSAVEATRGPAGARAGRDQATLG